VITARESLSAGAVRATLLVITLLAAVGIGSRISPALFYALGGVLLAAMGLLALRWPGVVLPVVVLAPVFDRYLFSLIVPESLRTSTTYFSEGLLIVVGAAIVFGAARSGRLVPALRHPVNALLLLFVALGIASAFVNGVPPGIAAAGIGFTVEASFLFSLARIVPLGVRGAWRTAIAFVMVASLAAVLAMGQVLLHPDLFGLESFTGRFGEGQRVAAFFDSPNMLGMLLAMAFPFAVFAALELSGRLRPVAWALAGLLSLSLLYTFSRGAWLALAVAMLVVGMTVSRRALAATVLIGLLSFGTAIVLPRHLLYAERDSEPFDLLAATFGRVESLGEGDLRVQFVDNAIPIIRDHPVLGAGPGRYGGAVARNEGSPLYDEYTAGTVPREQTVDNFWLHLLAEFGIAGSLVLLGALGVGVGRVIRAARRSAGRRRALQASFAAGVVVVMVGAISEMVLEANTIAFGTWLFLGLGSAVLPSAATPDGEARGQ
jgi:O-antigen ligase